MTEMVCLECATRQPVAGAPARLPRRRLCALGMSPHLCARRLAVRACGSPQRNMRLPGPHRCPCRLFRAASCTACGASMARYYCPICHLFDDEPGRHIYHCPFCNFCRQVRAAAALHCTPHAPPSFPQAALCPRKLRG